MMMMTACYIHRSYLSLQY